MTTEAKFTVFHPAVREDGIAVVTIDVPGESQNTLKAEFVSEAHALLDQLEQDATVQGVVLISGKPGSFIAGADINMLQACRTAAEATELSLAGQRFFDRLENFKTPVVAAIDGACLGGGLELALACQGRVCTDHPVSYTHLDVYKRQLYRVWRRGPRLVDLCSVNRVTK